MKSFIAVLVCLVSGLLHVAPAMAQVEAVNQVIEVPPVLREFVPQDHKLIAKLESDLNQDGVFDYLIVTQAPIPETDPMEAVRPLKILLGQKDGTHKLAVTSNKVVMCQDCGGVFGDPFEIILAEEGSFQVHHYGGSNWRWSYDYDFAFDPSEKDWFLTSVTDISYHVFEPDQQDSKTYTAKDFGKIKLKEFDPETYRPPENK